MKEHSLQIFGKIFQRQSVFLTHETEKRDLKAWAQMQNTCAIGFEIKGKLRALLDLVRTKRTNCDTGTDGWQSSATMAKFLFKRKWLCSHPKSAKKTPTASRRTKAIWQIYS